MKKEVLSEKKGISPVVATVLLITLVVVIALIIFLWLGNIIEDKGTKLGKNVELVCDDVIFEASYSGEELAVVNSGEIPIFGMKIKMSEEGSHVTKGLAEILSSPEDWPDIGLNPGRAFSGDISVVADSILLIPVLIGNSDEGTKTFVCAEQYGYEIIL